MQSRATWLVDAAPLGAALGLVVFVAALDQMVVVAALPTIMNDLEVPLTQLNRASWVVSGYLLGYTVALPVVGQVADVAGRRRALIGCLALFALGSLGCATAVGIDHLVLARFVQAFGGGALLPVANAIVTDRVATDRRAIALGGIGALAEAGGVLGPLYGAAIVDWLGWRTIFWLNLPLMVPAVAAAIFGTTGSSGNEGRLDLTGMVLATAVLGLLIVTFSDDPGSPRPTWLTAALVLGALVALVTFIWVERRTAHALIAPSLFRNPGLTMAAIASALSGVALIVALVDVPLFATAVLGRDTTGGALLLLRLTVFLPVGALLGGVLTRVVGLRATGVAGFVAASAGLAIAGIWPADVLETWLTVGLALIGFGLGLVVVPLTEAAIDTAGSERTATGASLVVVFRLVGMTVGIAALTSFGLGRFHDLTSGIPFPIPRQGEAAAELASRIALYEHAIRIVTVQVFNEIFHVTAAIAFLGAVAVVGLRGSRR